MTERIAVQLTTAEANTIGIALLMASRDHKDHIFKAIADRSAIMARFWAIELVRIARATYLIYGLPFPSDEVQS